MSARAFARLSENLAALEGIPSRIAAEVAGKINDELAREFDQGSDPYGAPWKPLLPSTVRRKGGDTRILRRDDDLSASTVATPTQGAGIEITSLPYGGVHQAGTTLAKRAILPDGADLPKSWEKAIADATTAAVKKVMAR